MPDDENVGVIYVEPQPRTHQTYLGDGLYAEFDGWQVWLFTHDGYQRTNAVALEPGVLTKFLAYLEALKSEAPAHGS